MDKIAYITPRFAVTGALTAADFRLIAAMGFRSVVNNRPDGEEAGQLTGADEAALAAAHGLAYRFIPAPKLELFSDGVVTAMQAALAELPGPVLAHCKAGMRSAIAWSAASSHSQPLDEVMAKVAAAGFDFDFLRDDFEALVLPSATAAEYVPAADTALPGAVPTAAPGVADARALTRAA